MDLDAAAAAYLKSFGQAVRRRRERLKVSQEQIALRSGIDRTYWSGIERATRNPTVRMVAKIAYALDTTPVKLFGAVGRASK